MSWPEVRRRGRSESFRLVVAPLAAAILVVLSAVACAPQDEGNLDMAVFALDRCSDQGAMATPQTVRVVVRGPGPCVDDETATCINELVDRTAKWGGVVNVGGIPEGDDREVTVLAYAGSGNDTETPIAYARATGVHIEKGESTDVDAILSRFGGESCPAVEGGDMPHRVFASVTRFGEGADARVLIAGGFTSVEGTEGAMKLTGADTGLFIYEPKLGKVRRVGDMQRPRGAHAAIYIPTKNWVVIFGGIDKLGFTPGQAGFPLHFSKEDAAGAFSDFEIFDVATESILTDKTCPPVECQACCDSEGNRLPSVPPECDQAEVDCQQCVCGCELNRGMVTGRVFAQPMVMSDGFVIITGGGDWPNHELSDYRLADVFDPEGNCGTGGFQDAAVLPRMESIRAGHTATFVETNDAGRYRYLLWGGTKETGRAEAGPNPIGETYVESSQQFKGISGVFRQVWVNNPELVRNLYFHTTTALTGRRFLVAGGVPRDGGVLGAPSRDDLYILTLHGEEDISVDIQRVEGGLEGGRYLHTATSHDGQRVLLFGGFGFDGSAIGDPWSFDVVTGGSVALPDHAPLARVGHRAVVLPDDTLLLVGGLYSPSDLDGTSGLVEVYTPTTLDPLK